MKKILATIGLLLILLSPIIAQEDIGSAERSDISRYITYEHGKTNEKLDALSIKIDEVKTPKTLTDEQKAEFEQILLEERYKTMYSVVMIVVLALFIREFVAFLFRRKERQIQHGY